MLAGTVAWPAETAARYRREGHWDGTVLFDIVRRGAARRPGQIALIDRDRRWTYAELHRDATRLAARLLALGLGPRDRVMVQLPNAAEFVLALLRARADRRNPGDGTAFAPAGGVAALPERLRSGRIRDRRSRRQFRLAHDGRRVAREASGLRQVIVAGDPLPGQHTLADLLPRRRRRRTSCDGRSGRRRHDAAVRRHDIDVEADPTHAPGLRAQRAPVRGGGGLRRAHGLHGDPAARPQLQPGLPGDPGRCSLSAARSCCRRRPTPTLCSRPCSASA